MLFFEAGYPVWGCFQGKPENHFLRIPLSRVISHQPSSLSYSRCLLGCNVSPAPSGNGYSILGTQWNIPISRWCKRPKPVPTWNTMATCGSFLLNRPPRVGGLHRWFGDWLGGWFPFSTFSEPWVQIPSPHQCQPLVKEYLID